MVSLSEEQVTGLADFLRASGDIAGGKFVKQLAKEAELVGKYFDSIGVLPVPDPANPRNKLHNLKERIESIMVYGLLIALGRK